MHCTGHALSGPAYEEKPKDWSSLHSEVLPRKSKVLELVIIGTAMACALDNCGVLAGNTYDFDETGIAKRLVSSIRVYSMYSTGTRLKILSKLYLMQPGDGELADVIEYMNDAGLALSLVSFPGGIQLYPS